VKFSEYTEKTVDEVFKDLKSGEFGLSEKEAESPGLEFLVSTK